MSLPTIDELKTLRENITPGPWEYQYDNSEEAHRMFSGTGEQRGFFMEDTEALRQSDPNWQLASLAPELLDEIIRRREEAGE